jgi:hypothetical protein
MGYFFLVVAAFFLLPFLVAICNHLLSDVMYGMYGTWLSPRP